MATGCLSHIAPRQPPAKGRAALCQRRRRRRAASAASTGPPTGS